MTLRRLTETREKSKSDDVRGCDEVREEQKNELKEV